MINYANGNILEFNGDAIVNAVNCRSVMGAGIALAFANAFPAMYKEYQKVCHDGDLVLGQLHTWKNPKPAAGKAKWVVNFPTMEWPGEYTKRDTIVSGFVALERFLKDNGIKSIGVPALGCGVGRFPWEDFKALAFDFDGRLPDVAVTVYVPHERH